MKMIEIIKTKQGLEITRFLPNVKCQDVLIAKDFVDMEKDVILVEN